MGSALRATGQLRHQWACPITRVSACPLWSVWFLVQNKTPLFKVKSRQPHNWPNRSWRSFCHCAYSQQLLVGRGGARLGHFGSLSPEANKDRSCTCGTVGQGALQGHRYVWRTEASHRCYREHLFSPSMCQARSLVLRILWKARDYNPQLPKAHILVGETDRKWG